MKPRRTPTSQTVFRLPGGNEDNDLWVEWGEDDFNAPVIISVWELTDEEREAIASGGTIELLIWGKGHPPVALSVGASLAERKGAVA